MVELVYPCKCACGQRGRFVVGLHVLALGYLMANSAFIKAAGRRGKSSMVIYPYSSDVVRNLLDKFDCVVTNCAKGMIVGPTEDDRRRLGLSAEGWRAFRRRMGYPPEDDQ